jgi:hypothetical protein
VGGRPDHCRGAQTDIDRITTIWRDCLERYGGPYLFGSTPTAADAIYAPICTRFQTYDVSLDADRARYRDTMLAHPPMIDWIEQANVESENLDGAENHYGRSARLHDPSRFASALGEDATGSKYAAGVGVLT